MKFHSESVGSKQCQAIRRLGPLLSGVNCYLAGGTALALYLGHRRSVDLDWFTNSRFRSQKLLDRLREGRLRPLVQQMEPGTFVGVVSGVPISVFRYPYRLLRPAVDCPELEVSLASLPDLAAMKLEAISQRGVKRDFVDIYALGQRFTLKAMLRWYQEKYDIENIIHLLYGLSYFEDAEKNPMPRLHWNIDWTELKQTIKHWVHEIDPRRFPP